MDCYKCPSVPVLFQGDIHINARLSFEFEQRRLRSLAEAYNTKAKNSPDRPILVLIGDVFDYDTPSYEELKLFYQFIGLLSDAFDIYITAGNHDPTIFTFIPHIGFTYIHTEAELKVATDTFHIVSWEHLGTIMDTMEKTSRILVSHARCTMGNHIKEEVNFEKLSQCYRLAIMGDIHDAYRPKDNIVYTSSPSAVTFKKSQATHGFLYYQEGNLEFINLDIPTKIVREFNAEEAVSFIKTLGNPRDYYKVKIYDTMENLQKVRRVSHPKVVKEPIPSVSEKEELPKEFLQSLETIKDFLSAKADATKYLFDYVGNRYRVPQHTVVDYLNLFKGFTKKKGKR